MVAAITFTPTHAKVGATVAINGTGFTALATPVTFTFAGSPITATDAPISVGAGGAFTAHIVIPAAINDVNVVNADDGTANANGNFTVDAGTSLSISSGHVGDTTVITGTGFGNAETVTFTFGGVAITPTGAPITSDATGGFTATITIPAGSAQSVQGAKNVVSTGGTSTGTDTSVYTITPKLVVSPTHGAVGATVTVTLSGYAATSALTATIHGTSVTLASSTSTANGDKSTTFVVPSTGVVDGANTVSIHDAVPNTATASFELAIASFGVSINSVFTHLNGRNLHVKNNTPCREREAIVDVAFDSTDTYETGGMPVDFSGIEHFQQIYICDIAHKTYGLAVEFVPANNNSASGGKLKFYDSSGVELSSGNTAIQSQSLRCRIRGI